MDPKQMQAALGALMALVSRPAEVAAQLAELATATDAAWAAKEDAIRERGALANERLQLDQREATISARELALDAVVDAEAPKPRRRKG